MKLRDIVKTDNILTASPQDTLSHALSKLKSSHDSAFVFDDKRKLLGVINPYFSLIKNSYPGNAKVMHCLVMPPKLKYSQSPAEAIRLMVESKIHFLPVYDEKQEFLGIVSARHILTALHSNEILSGGIWQFLKTKRLPITIEEDDKISKALTLFKQYKVSKLVVVNKAGKLRGLLSYYDLISFLAVPKERLGEGARKGNKIPILNYKVSNYMKTIVYTLHQDSSLFDSAKLILDRKVGSVVIVNKENYPVGIVTTRDILQLVTRSTEEGRINVIGKNLSHASKHLVAVFSERLQRVISKKKDVEKVTLTVKEEKDGGLFSVLFSFWPKKGSHEEVIKTEGRDLTEVLTTVKKKLKNEEDHMDR